MPPFKDSWFGKAVWKLGDTIKGKTKVGQIAHELLPAKKARSVVGELIKGTKAVSPVPEIKSPEIREHVEEAIPKLQEAKDGRLNQADLEQVVGEVLDLLDDGTVNGSKEYEDLSPVWKKRINVAWQLVLFGIAVHQIYMNWDSIISALGL